MHLVTTGSSDTHYSWKEAVLSGLAPDGELFIPTSLPALSEDTVGEFRSCSLAEIGFWVARSFLSAEVPDETLRKICDESFNFPLRLAQVTEHISVLELFHGPTCAFKDFGARFMARLFRHFLGSVGEKLRVLVATSGDTGSAVANAFFDPSPEAPISVTVLFPKGKVSLVQEKQMTTLGHNVRVLEVAGTFDDCQRLVKSALADPSLTRGMRLTSANSINIARLLPQSFYYLWAQSRLPEGSSPLFSVPSGNLGNVTGGVIAYLMGMPTSLFVAAHNSNDVFPRYLASGSFEPTASVETISNAMDVGNPSNFIRLQALGGSLSTGASRTTLTTLLKGATYSDQATLTAMRRVYDTYGYMLDPHSAIGFLGAESFRAIGQSDNPAIVLGTAHPAKFPEATMRALNREPIPPEQLSKAMELPGTKTEMASRYEVFRELLSLS